MMNFYDIAYGVGVGISAPYWLARGRARRKVLRAFRERMGNVEARPPTGKAVMIHAVSLGEINAARALVEVLRHERPDVDLIISTTTDTGFDRATKLWGSADSVRVIRYPLDFTSAVRRVLDRLKPSVVVLMELEVWPNFVRECEARDVPVAVVNARLTEMSFRRYQRLGLVTRNIFNRVSVVCAQDRQYGERFVQLGVPSRRVLITGSMKFDTAMLGRVEGARELAQAVGLRPGNESIWVCGSTGPGEEAIVLTTYRALLRKFPRLRLVIVPRHPERFDEVEMLIGDARLACVRRSRGVAAQNNTVLPPVALGDTMGELRKFYNLADVVFVGRSLVDLGPRQHGSDMIEPAALAKPIVVGPFTHNFADAMNRLREKDAVMEVRDAEQLEQAVGVLLSTPAEAQSMGQRAAEVVRNNQGATLRNVELILRLLSGHRDIADEVRSRRMAHPGAA